MQKTIRDILKEWQMEITDYCFYKLSKTVNYQK